MFSGTPSPRIDLSQIQRNAGRTKLDDGALTQHSALVDLVAECELLLLDRWIRQHRDLARYRIVLFLLDHMT